MSSGLARYAASRALGALATVAGVVTIVFLLVRLIPGDPVDAILGDQSTAEDRAALRTTLGLDRPLGEQYVAFVGRVLDGTLGESFRHRGATVSSLIVEVLPATVVLAVAAILLAWSIALPLGTFSASKVGTPWDRGTRALAVVGIAMPTIWLGPLLILVFGVELRILPLPGDDAAGVLSLVLPATTLGMGLAAILTRQTRAAMLEVLSEQYVLAARARGLSERAVLVRHALRNALLPVMTVGAAQLGAILAGAVVTEKIFERRGLGTLFLDAFFDRDIPVVQGCVLVIATVYVVVNLIADLMYGLVDPRVRLS